MDTSDDCSTSGRRQVGASEDVEVCIQLRLQARVAVFLHSAIFRLGFGHEPRDHAVRISDLLTQRRRRSAQRWRPFSIGDPNHAAC